MLFRNTRTASTGWAIFGRPGGSGPERVLEHELPFYPGGPKERTVGRIRGRAVALPVLCQSCGLGS